MCRRMLGRRTSRERNFLTINHETIPNFDFWRHNGHKNNCELAREFGGSEYVYRKWRKRITQDNGDEKHDWFFVKTIKEMLNNGTIKESVKNGDNVVKLTHKGEHELAKSSSFSQTRTALIIPDAHIPFHDKQAYGLMLKVAQDVMPDEIVILGDYGDFNSVSGHDKQWL